MSSQDLKKDSGKPKFHLLPLEDLDDLVRVYEFGCEKYEEESWRQFAPTKENYNRIYSALMRHLAQWHKAHVEGEFSNDEESGLPTIAHVLWNAVMLTHMEKEERKNYED